MEESLGERTRLLRGGVAQPSGRRVRTSSAARLPIASAQPHHQSRIRFFGERDKSPSGRARFVGIGITIMFALGLISTISSKSAEHDALAADMASRASEAAALGDLKPSAGGAGGEHRHGSLDFDATVAVGGMGSYYGDSSRRGEKGRDGQLTRDVGAREYDAVGEFGSYCEQQGF